MRKPHLSIGNQLNTANTEMRQKIAEIMLPIVKTVLFLGMLMFSSIGSKSFHGTSGRHQLPLRGHQEHTASTLSIGTNPSEGIFRALLRFRVDSGDVDLQRHLENCSKNASYISPHIQNEIIDVIGHIILETLVERIKKAKYVFHSIIIPINDYVLHRLYSILVDETTDAAHLAQCCYVFRYVDKADNGSLQIREDFVSLKELEGLTGQHIAASILSTVRKIGLDLSNLVILFPYISIRIRSHICLGWPRL